MAGELVEKPPKLPQSITFRNRGLSQNSKLAYSNAVKDYYRFLKENNLEEGFKSLRKWLDSIDNANTFNQRLQAIKEYLIKRFENESLAARIELNDFFSSIKRISPDHAIKEIDYLTKDQVEELAEKSIDSISCFVLALFWTGCRITELINIKIKDCKVNNVVSIKIRGKGKREREVYISRKLYNKIRKTFEGKTYLFQNKKGQPYSRIYVSRKINEEARKHLGVEVSAHTLRHSKAMFLKKDKGLTPDQIAKALGHGSVVTTLQYYFHGTPTAEEQGIV